MCCVVCCVVLCCVVLCVVCCVVLCCVVLCDVMCIVCRVRCILWMAIPGSSTSTVLRGCSEQHSGKGVVPPRVKWQQLHTHTHSLVKYLSYFHCHFSLTGTIRLVPFLIKFLFSSFTEGSWGDFNDVELYVYHVLTCVCGRFRGWGWRDSNEVDLWQFTVYVRRKWMITWCSSLDHFRPRVRERKVRMGIFNVVELCSACHANLVSWHS